MIELLSLVREAEELIVRGLSLGPAALPRELAHAEGTWKGAPVRIDARAFTGGPLRFARFIELSGPGLAIGNALALPRRDLGLPIFGADLVAIGGGPAMIAADLSPTAPVMLDALAKRPALPQGGELPAWCKRCFSPHALYTRIGPERLLEAREAFLVFPRVLLQLEARPADAAEAQREYARAHLEDDKGLGLLARMFGQAWAARFLREVMFPE